MNKHTKGPWYVVPVDPEHSEHCNCNCDKADGAYSINQVCAPGQAEFYATPLLSEVEANAQLIAAAPELLEALKATLLYIELYGGEVTQNFAGSNNENLSYYKKLINKAEGEE